jgi:hypothetical protein
MLWLPHSDCGHVDFERLHVSGLLPCWFETGSTFLTTARHTSNRASDCTATLTTGKPALAGITTGYELDDRGTISGTGKRFSSSPQHLDRFTGPPSLYQWVPGALSMEKKCPRREADHSPESSAEAKNGRAIPPLPRDCMAWCLIN